MFNLFNPFINFIYGWNSWWHDIPRSLTFIHITIMKNYKIFQTIHVTLYKSQSSKYQISNPQTNRIKKIKRPDRPKTSKRTDWEPLSTCVCVCVWVRCLRVVARGSGPVPAPRPRHGSRVTPSPRPSFAPLCNHPILYILRAVYAYQSIYVYFLDLSVCVREILRVVCGALDSMREWFGRSLVLSRKCWREQSVGL